MELLRFFRHLLAAGVVLFILLVCVEIFDMWDDFDERV